LQRLWKTGELSTTDYLVQLKQSLDTQASALQQRSLMWRNYAEWLLASGEIRQWLQTDDPDTTSDGHAAVAGDES
jgi:cobalt-zinc-cadmium efflux system outer membrane protein